MTLGMHTATPSRWASLIEGLLERESFSKGVIVTGCMGLGSIGAGGMYAAGVISAKIPLAATALTLASAKFFAGAEKTHKIFTKHFPQAIKLALSVCGAPVQADRATGVWLGRNAEKAQFFNKDLANVIGRFFKQMDIKSCYDFGCGHNLYAKALFDQHGIDCKGVDGNSQIKEYAYGNPIIADLTQSFEREPRDCVISLEVGDKIPPCHQAAFIDNICNAAKKYVIISWPIPGQKGPHQVNCLSNEAVIKEFTKRGWGHDPFFQQGLREESGRIQYWFKDSLMLFEKVD